jgi:uncharacterized protein YpbB
MAEADLDRIIRSIGKREHKTLMDAARKRHAKLMGLAAKAGNREARDRLKQLARTTLLVAGSAARRLQVTAENAADSYARSMKKAMEEIRQAAEAKAAKKATTQARKKKS